MNQFKSLFTKHKIKDWILITIGVAIAASAFSFFISPIDMVIGGVSGIGVIIKTITGGYDPAMIILICNILLLFIGLLFLGKEFFMKTAYGSLLFPGFIKVFDLLYNAFDFNPSIQSLDMVLITLFSSIIMGVGLGIVIKHGGTTGGTEIPQKILFKYFHVPYSISLYAIDGLVIFTGFLVIGRLNLVLYAIIFTYLAGLVMDTVVFSGFNRRAVYIISEKNEEIKQEILMNFERGVTSIRVVGEFKQQEKKMLVCVLSTMEYFKLRDIIEFFDPKAFYFAVRANEVRGEGFSYVHK